MKIDSAMSLLDRLEHGAVLLAVAVLATSGSRGILKPVAVKKARKLAPKSSLSRDP